MLINDLVMQNEVVSPSHLVLLFSFMAPYCTGALLQLIGKKFATTN